MARYTGRLREQGYIVFPNALPDDMIDRLMALAMATPAKVRRMDHQDCPGHEEAILFDPTAPQAVRYDYDVQQLLDNRDVQNLLADHSQLALAQHYLGGLPRADILTMWWHTNFHSRPDSHAAQFYHFDMDCVKWLKIFIYMAEVAASDRPHSFIAGSHRTNGIPGPLLQKGHSRLTDHEVFTHYDAGKEIIFSVQKVTIIVEDTRGPHKGNPVAQNRSSRLVLQLQFSNSLFGADVAKGTLGHPVDPRLITMLRARPAIYTQYL